MISKEQYKLNLEKPEWIEPGCCWNKMFESI